MTRAVLDIVGYAKGADGLVLAALALAILPFALVRDGVASLASLMADRRLIDVRIVRCSAGHEVNLIGTWTCPGCGTVRDGAHVFSTCECGTQAEACLCACARVIRNPRTRK